MSKICESQHNVQKILKKMSESFAKRLNQLRKAKKYSQQDLADKLDIARNSISNWEKGKNQPRSSDLLFQIAQVLDSSVDYLMGFDSISHNHESFHLNEPGDMKYKEKLENQTIQSNEIEKLKQKIHDLEIETNAYLKAFRAQGQGMESFRQQDSSKTA